MAIALVPFLIWPILADRILTSSFLPHLYCYLGKPGLVWTHVIADSLIGLSYVMISGTLVYLVQKGRRDIPFHWMFLAFGAFIVACGGTHFMEVVTVWIPVYVLSASVKVVTALASVATAVLLPFTVPRVLSLIHAGKLSEAAEAKFHQMADNIQEIFWMVDAITQQIIYVNPAFEQITGRTRASLQEAPLYYRELIHPDDKARFLSRLDEARRTGKFAEEFRITRPDGTIRWIESRGFPVRDAEGNIYRLAGVAQDITERKQGEDALRRSEAEAKARAEELEVILDAVPGMALIARDPACRKITGSRAAYEMLRLPYGANISRQAPERERHTNFRVVKNGRELSPSELPLTRAAVTGHEVSESEFTLEFEGGTSREMLGNAAPLLDDKGAVRGAVGFFVDITERKRAEEALRKSEERFRLAAESGKMFAYEWDAATDVIVRSAEAAQILGIDEAALVTGHELWAKVHADDRERLSAALAGLTPDKPHLQISYRLVRPDSTVMWVDGSGRAHFDEHGRTLRMVGMVTDITERKRAEEELQQAQTRIESILESVSDIHILFDQDWHYLYINRAAVRAIGRSREQILGRTLWEIYPDIVGTELERQYRHAMKERVPVSFDFHYSTTGTWWENRFYPAPEGLLVFATNITESKRAKEALQEAQAELARMIRIVTMGELTASIAHEINQPLAAVATNASASLHWLAVRPPNLHEARESAKRAIQETNRASGVIQRIRALLRKEQPQMQPLDGNEVIREVVHLAENELLRRGVGVKTEMGADVPAVLGDRIQLQQVILNLVMNAIDAMSTIVDRPRELVIRSAGHPEGVLVQVQDSGRGLNPEQAHHIFEPFFTTKPQGIGMGLSISRSIVEAHGGHLWATPGLPHGTVFQFTLPKANGHHE